MGFDVDRTPYIMIMDVVTVYVGTVTIPLIMAKAVPILHIKVLISAAEWVKSISDYRQDGIKRHAGKPTTARYTRLVSRKRVLSPQY
jgi:hypothetical protein